MNIKLRFFLFFLPVWGIWQLAACQERNVDALLTITPTSKSSRIVFLTRTPRSTFTPVPPPTATMIIPRGTPFPLEDELPGKIIFNYGFMGEEFETRMLYLDGFREQVVRHSYDYFNFPPYGEDNHG